MEGNDILSICLHHIFEVVAVIFHGKFHHCNSLFRYHFEVNNMYKIDVLGYYLNFDNFGRPKKFGNVSK
jgi:hypothetical protein